MQGNCQRKPYLLTGQSWKPVRTNIHVQIAVDSEYIMAADIFQDRNDVWTLVPFLKTMKEKLGFRYPGVTADSGYYGLQSHCTVFHFSM